MLEERVHKHLNSDPLLPIGPSDGEKVWKRGLTFVVFALMLGVFSGALVQRKICVCRKTNLVFLVQTFGWIPLFSMLKESEVGEYAHSFFEGLSGGMCALENVVLC